MPIKIKRNFPALEQLRDENIFVMDEERAEHQDIRPLNVLILNLMPQKMVTESQLLRHLANTPLQLNVQFLHMASHESKTTPMAHMQAFYESFEDIEDRYYDGLIITGAPVEQLAFEDVDYWQEFTDLIEWSKRHVYSTLHICWGAQAGLYARYGIEKSPLEKKLSGVYDQEVFEPGHLLMRGFDDIYRAPHSRYTTVEASELDKAPHLQILASGREAGLSLVVSENLREIYSFGHLEYDRETLGLEYARDVKAGKNPEIPAHYYPGNQVDACPLFSWNSAAALFFNNWINYAVYQETPYDWTDWSSQL